MSTVQHGRLTSLAKFYVFGPKMFSLISRFMEIAQVKERCQRYQSDVLKSMRPFSFFGINFFFSISISGGRTDKREVSTVTKRCFEQYASILVFRWEKFSSISQFLEVALVKGRCQRYQRDALNSI